MWSLIDTSFGGSEIRCKSNAKLRQDCISSYYIIGLVLYVNWHIFLRCLLTLPFFLSFSWNNHWMVEWFQCQLRIYCLSVKHSDVISSLLSILSSFCQSYLFFRQFEMLQQWSVWENMDGEFDGKEHGKISQELLQEHYLHPHLFIEFTKHYVWKTFTQ